MGIFGGLFQGKTVTQESTSVSRVVEDKLIPNSAKTGALRDLIRGDDMLVEHVMDSMLNGPGITTERMYRWAKDKYFYGLPDVTYLTNNSSRNLVKAIIEDTEGQGVDIIYSEYGPFNTLHYGWKYLFESHQYDFESNEIKSLSAAKGFPVYLVKMTAVIPEGVMDQLETGALTQWGPSSSSGYTPRRAGTGLNIPALSQSARMDYVLDTYTTEEAIEYTYCWMEVTNQRVGNNTVQQRTYKEESVRIPIPYTQEQQNNGYFQAMYTIASPYTVTEFNWATGQDEQVTKYTKQYKCFTYLNGSGEHPELDELFQPKYSEFGSFFPFTYFRDGFRDMTGDKTSDHYKSSKKLCKKLGFDYQTVSDAVNENPDIGSIKEAIMVFGVPPDTTNELEQRYLFDFFYRAYVRTGAVSSSIFNERDPNDPNGIFRRYLPPPAQTAIVLKDKKFEMSVKFTAIRVKFKTGTVAAVGKYKGGTGVESQTVPIQMADTESGHSSTYDHVEEVVYHYYQKQVAPNLYQEIKVYGVNPSHLLIPLDYSITEEYNISDREVLYTRSLHFVFKAQVSTKLKWYQKSWFKAVMIIIAIIWTVLTWGSDGGTALGAALTAGEYALAAMIVIEAILINVAIGLAINVVMKFVAKAIGGQAAVILGAVLMVVALAYGVYNGPSNAPWASTMLTAANGLVKAGMNELTIDLQKEFDSFNLEKDLKVKELEEAQKLLENQNVLSPFTVFGEAPQDYYNRTVHSGNIGVQSIDMISNYVDISLRLPRIYETITPDHVLA